MYPEKMTFDEFLFRTSRINEAAQMIYSLDEDHSENKNTTNGNNSSFVLPGRDDWIRTSGPYVPNVVRYRAALHPEINVFSNLEHFFNYRSIGISHL
jgi:hypothetical protein